MLNSKEVGSLIYTLGEQYCSRGRILSDEGWTGSNLLMELTLGSRYFENQDARELNEIETEIVKEKISRGSYKSVLLKNLKSIASSAYEKSGKVWDTNVCSYYRNVEYARCNEKENFREFLRDSRYRLEKNKVNEWKSKCTSIPIENYVGKDKFYLRKMVVAHIDERLMGKGFYQNKQLSNKSLKIWTKTIANDYFLGLVLDTDVLFDTSDGKSGRLDFSYMIGKYCENGNTLTSYNPIKFHVTLPEHWFPIARFPFTNVYQDFATSEGLLVCLAASLFMFNEYCQLIEGRL
jgi:hypothetical protein